MKQEQKPWPKISVSIVQVLLYNTASMMKEGPFRKNPVHDRQLNHTVYLQPAPKYIAITLVWILCIPYDENYWAVETIEELDCSETGNIR